MKIRHASEWLPDWDKHPTWTKVIDLRGCNTQAEMIRACAGVLHGSNSAMGGMRNEPNLNWMQDVVGDWFSENWGLKKSILIVGGASLFKVGPEFALNFIDVLNSSKTDAILNRCLSHDADGVVPEILNTNIWLYLN